MGKSYYDAISIKDLPYYYGSATYISTFKNNKIETLEDLLDKEKMDQLIERARKTKTEMKGLVEIVRHQYLDEPLRTEGLLDKKMRIGYSNGQNAEYTLSHPSGEFYTRLTDRNLYEKLVLDMPYDCTNLIRNVIKNNIDLKGKLESGKLKVVDFMDSVINTKTFLNAADSQKRCRIMAEIYRISKKCYDEKQNGSSGIILEPGARKILGDRLVQIQCIREALDKEEIEIKQKLLVPTQSSEQKSL